MPLAEQDRTLWNQGLLREGIALVERTLPTGPVGPFQLQAAIAAVHAEATRAEDTDWAQIEALYRMLRDLAPSPVVTLNHAVAVAMVDGPAAGLGMLDALLQDRVMQRNHRLHAVRAHLLEMDGRRKRLVRSMPAQRGLATSIPEQRYLNAKATSQERRMDIMSDSIKLSSPAINCPDSAKLAAFYADITGGEVTVFDDAWAMVTGPGGRIDFQKVPDFTAPTWPEPTVPMHMHLDFYVDDLAATEARVLAAGATKYEFQPNAEHCIVFADPAGNPFCLSTWDQLQH